MVLLSLCVYIVFSSQTYFQLLANREYVFQIYHFEIQIPIMFSLCFVKVDFYHNAASGGTRQPALLSWDLDIQLWAQLFTWFSTRIASGFLRFEPGSLKFLYYVSVFVLKKEKITAIYSIFIFSMTKWPILCKLKKVLQEVHGPSIKLLSYPQSKAKGVISPVASEIGTQYKTQIFGCFPSILCIIP